MNWRIFLLALLLGGCVPQSEQQPSADVPSEWHSYKNTAYGYTIAIPDSAFIVNKSTEKDQIFFGNIKQFNKNKGDEFDISIYAGSKASSCAGSVTGADDTRELQDTKRKATWGKVNFFEVYGSGGQGWIDYEGPTPLCALSIPVHGSAYALCSQRDEGTVIVCVSQVTDDPAMAEKIFRTFRWTDE